MSLKRMIAVGLVAGMLAVTGCSGNIPSRNQGNRNGQRVADAVNRRPDSYTGRTRGLFGRTSGVNSRYTRTPNRSNTFGRPQNRIGHTFRYGNDYNSYPRTLNEDIGSGTARYEMNRTERGVSNTGTNRAARRSGNRTNSGTRRAHTATHNTVSRQATANRAATNRTATNRVTRNATANNTEATNQTNQINNDQGVTRNQPAAVANNTVTSRANVNTHRATTNRVSTNRAGTNRANTHRATTNRATTNRATADGVTTNRATTNRARTTRNHSAQNTAMHNRSIGAVNSTTTPVFFNKSKAVPESQVPVNVPAPAPTPAPAVPQAS